MHKIHYIYSNSLNDKNKKYYIICDIKFKLIYLWQFNVIDNFDWLSNYIYFKIIG